MAGGRAGGVQRPILAAQGPQDFLSSVLGEESQLTTLKAQEGTAVVLVSSRYFSQQKLSGSG